nr:hypothetical protein [Tanacetum cinerariifolium]
MVSFVKLHILKKGKCILSTMKMKQYLAHTDYALWEVILNGNCVVQMTKDEAGITSYEYWLWIVSSGWSSVPTILGQMTYPVAILTLDSVRSYVMQGASFTHGIVSSIPISGSISPEGFLLPILLVVVIIIMVVIVAVILIVIVIAIAGGVIVVAIIRVVVVIDVSSILKLSFVIIVDLIGDEDPTDLDGDTEVSVSLGEISSEGKKYRESNIDEKLYAEARIFRVQKGDAGEFALMGVTSEYNELNEQNSEYFMQLQAYKNSLKTLEKQKRVLQRNQLTLEDKIRVLSIELENTSNLLKHSERINADFKTAKKDIQTKLDNHLVQTENENKLGWDGSAFSVFTTNSEDVEGRPIFHSDKSSEVNTNDFASNDSSIKFSEHQPNDSTSCASTSSDLPSFTCNSSDKNEHTSRTSCNKNGYFNKKAGHFKKNASSVSKLCFVCDSGTHLIKDCDFYEKQMANKTVGTEVGPMLDKNKVHHQNQFVPQAVLLWTGKVNIPPARPQPVPTCKPKVFAPIPAGRKNRPFLVPTDRGYSPSVSSGWWNNTARTMPYFSRPTSSLFQTYTPYVPIMSYNHMKYGRDRWATPVKPLAGCS